MYKYFKAISNILKNYKFYSFHVLFYEIIFYLLHEKKINQFEYLNSNFLSDSIPCPYFFLKKINKFTNDKKLEQMCDLGSGFGKILYYFGKIKKIKIDGIEYEKKIYLSSKSLENDKIKIFNDDILKFNLKKKQYDLFFLNDPLKNKLDLLTIILKIKKEYQSVYLIFINLDNEKKNIIFKNLNMIKKFEISENKNIFFCKLS